jgi:hypothetical protein
MEDAENEQNNGQDRPAFVFDTWVEEAGLNRKAVAILRTEALTVKRALLLLSPGDIRSLNLQLGQEKLLETAVEQLKPAAAVPEMPVQQQIAGDVHIAVEVQRAGDVQIAGDVTNDQQPQQQAAADGMNTRDTRGIVGADVGTSLHDLLAETRASTQVTTNTGTRSRSDCDPRSILTVKATTTKAVHILQFLPERAKQRRQGRRREFILANGEEQIVLRPEETHPYSGFTLAEWGAANAKVMNHLLQSSVLARSEVEYYLAYTAKVFELATKYEWDSVLEYDHSYREMQAEHGFLWGTFNPHMELQILQPRKPAPRGDNGRTPWKAAAGSAPTQECWNFKAKGHCAFGDDCKYSHGEKTGPKASAKN